MKRLFSLILSVCWASAALASDVQDGMVKTADGVELYYVKSGDGPKTVILPGRLFAFDSFRWLAEDYTLISYDMRNRGRSSAVKDAAKITIEADVQDLEAVRKHFGVERFNVMGYSYLGFMVALYAMEHPQRVERIVQLGPVPLKYDTQYRAEYVASDRQKVIEEHGGARLSELRAKNYHTTNPKEYCEEEWRVVRYMLVGDPSRVEALGPSQCEMSNEWPVNLARHFEHHFVGSVQKLNVPRERAQALATPTLTIHGTLDRNAPYGAGREWSYMLPNGRLITLEGAAHQAFVEEPKAVREAVTTFFKGEWPKSAEKVTEDPRRSGS